jgi:hypothetical protein
MSEENVETISRAIDAWNRGDLDGFLAGAHPDIEWHPVLPAGVEGSGGVYRGHDEARQFWAEFWAMFDEFRIAIQSARAVIAGFPDSPSGKWVFFYTDAFGGFQICAMSRTTLPSAPAA